MLDLVLHLGFLFLVVFVCLHTCYKHKYSLGRSAFSLNIVLWYMAVLLFMETRLRFDWVLFTIIACMVGAGLGWYTADIYNYLFKEEDHV